MEADCILAIRNRLLLYIMLVPLLSGCAALSPRRIDPKPQTFAAVPATVFVADGAGNFQSASLFLRKTVEADGYPIEVITYEWSHGDRRIIRDHLDLAHARCEGKKLAAVVAAYHAANPERPIYLLAHSAGTVVALTAVEHLPPHVVRRAVILAPSVSRYYDLQPALRGVKDDVHVFHSPRDWFYLGLVTRVIGTSDLHCARTAGRFGFLTYSNSAEPDTLHKLVQHRWQRDERELGHNGGHFGSYQPDYLREFVIPLLNPHPKGSHR